MNTEHPEVVFKTCLEKQRGAYLGEATPSLVQRRQDLSALKRLLSENADAIASAISEDYGNRSRHETLLAEVIPAIDSINDSLKHLKRWMKPQRRHVDHIVYTGGKNRVIPQPLGVVGVVVPWNFPINLSFCPLSSILAAGNRAMVKMSGNSTALTRLLIRLSPRYLPEEKLCFFEGKRGTGSAFTQLPFDLMIFTGSGEVGKQVMAAAAKNLTPVILELGGKAPAIIDRHFPLTKAVERLMFVKQFNAGQICTTVDYVFVHEEEQNHFVDEVKRWVNTHCADINSNDYSSIIDDTAFARLQETISDAEEKGATVIPLQAQAANPETRKLPLHLILNTREGMIVRERETFGPLLMVLTYKDEQEVIDYVNSKDRPLAIYPFSNNKALIAKYIDRIMSGGVTVNDALMHVGQHDLPFGGVGPSGMGHYHGYEGFLSCSKMRPVFYRARFSFLKLLAPPYKGLTNFAVKTLLKLKG